AEVPGRHGAASDLHVHDQHGHGHYPAARPRGCGGFVAAAARAGPRTAVGALRRRPMKALRLVAVIAACGFAAPAAAAAAAPPPVIMASSCCPMIKAGTGDRRVTYRRRRSLPTLHSPTLNMAGRPRIVGCCWPPVTAASTGGWPNASALKSRLCPWHSTAAAV